MWYEYVYKKQSYLLYIVLVLLFFILLISYSFCRAPRDFPTNSMYTVEKGVGLTALADDLQDNNTIKSPFLFKVFSVLTGGTKGIMAGDYVLEGPQSVIRLAYRFTHGEFDLDPVRITIPEGLNIFEVAKLVSVKFSKITEEEFITEGKDFEGYLFPDTYTFLPNATADEIIKKMRQTFQEKIQTLDAEISSSKRSRTDIIKMASIIEKEVRKYETMQTVAGILWKRIDIGMPLQVDASFKYINGEGTKDLSLDDLKIDSPYNSYLYKGLPPTPISNPGLESIRATLNPVKTDYLYFLTDKKGYMHYAKTFAEHLQNKNLYLK